MAKAKKAKKLISKQYEYEVAGVTLSATDGSDRQQHLKELFEEDLETSKFSRDHEVVFGEYDNKGSKAFAVIVDGKEIGDLEPDKIEEVIEKSKNAKRVTAEFGFNGHDPDEYQSIIDHYKDKKFWKQEDPEFDDAKANRDYEELMKSLKEGGEYQAKLHIFVEEEPTAEDIAAEASRFTDEERKENADIEQNEKLFKMIFYFSIILLIIGVMYLKVSLIWGMMNILFGLIGIILSRNFRKRLKLLKEQRAKQKEEAEKEQEQ